PPAPPAAVVTRLPSAPREDRFGLDASALASARGVAASTWAFGGAAAFDAAFWGRRRWRPVVWVTGGLGAPLTTSTPVVSLTTRVYSVRVVPGLELARAGPLRFAAGVGYGVDLFRVDASPTETLPVTVLGPTTFADPVIEAEIVIRARLFQSAGLILLATLDYDTAPHRYYDFNA